ncbi:MAG: class I SAM-dependent methyltransferase [Caldilineaceae bacterium]
MAEFHFVEDYERVVEELLRTYPIDEAMERAVGGQYERLGKIETDLLCWAGLRDGMTLVDVGCGSGRLAHAISKVRHIEYIGTDIVQSLLDYAKTKSPPHYQFKLHRSLSVPIPDASCDFVCAFSVFTHLLHEESYLYLEDARRALRPGGAVVLSFLEFGDPSHWVAFEGAVEGQRTRTRPHLNTFIERGALDAWANHLGFLREEFVSGSEAPWRGEPLWQSLAILRKPSGG